MGESREARYTQQRVDQVARNKNIVGRDFYMAGDPIDGRVVQQVRGIEIMVVDFEKDHALRDFYKFTIESYNKWSFEAWPTYLSKKLQERMVYDMDFVDGILMGDEKIREAARLGAYGGPVSKLINNLPENLVNRKIYVGDYLRFGRAVCRQYGVIATACMQRSILEGRVKGWNWAEYRGTWKLEGHSGHGWAALSKQGTDRIWVVDAASDYSGWQDSREAPHNYGAGYENHVFGVPDR